MSGEGEVGPDPYDRPVFIQGHNHAEPICAWPDCTTYLTRDQMAEVMATATSPKHPV